MRGIDGEPASVASATVTLSATAYTYDGTAKRPGVTVKRGSTTLVNGTHYTVSYANNVNAGTASVTVTGKGLYTGTSTKTFTISPASISGAAVTGIADRTYNGGAQTQSPAVRVGSRTLAAGTNYALSYANNVNAGTATVYIAGKGNYTGATSRTFSIAKAKNTLKASGKTVSVSKKKTKKLSRSSVIKVSKAKGKVAYKKLSGSKKITVNAKTGKVTVKKGLKKGRTYKVKVRVTAKGNANYKSGSKTATFKVRVH